MIKTEQLQLILALAKAGSFHKASEVLYTSQPALSHSLKKLEEELEVALFERSTTGVRATAIGEEILPHAQNVVSELNAILLLCSKHNLAQAQPAQQGQLILTSYFAVTDTLLPEVFAELKLYLNNTEISLRSISQNDALPLPADNEIILFFEDTDQPVPLPEGIVKYVICPVGLLVILHKDFLTPLPSSLKETELLQLPLITFLGDATHNSLISNAFVAHLHTIGTPQIVTDVPFSSMYRSCLEKKLGVGLSLQLGLSPLKSSADNMVSIPLKHTMRQSFCLSLMHKDSFTPQISAIVRQIIHNQLLA